MAQPVAQPIRKGARTRQRILERAAPVFNQRGYAGASMSALVEATGLEKGGIYNHFGSKDALALEAFDYAVSLVVRSFADAQRGSDGAVARLVAIIDAFGRSATRPLVPGGCPVMNTAIESADTHPALAERAYRAMLSWHRLIGSIVKAGKQSGELDPRTDAYDLATIVTATLEGALMLSNLMADPSHMERAMAHLTRHVESLRRQPTRRTRQKEPR
jgi:TetR/AcrR family transcriptional regulator, transcriptional repressor for nem operon